MAAQNFRLVFQGKIAPDQDLAQVKVRMQQLFKKDAQTIEKLFNGKKIPLKQGLNQSQAIQYKEKLRSMGILCEMESQKPQNKASPGSRHAPASAARSRNDKPLKYNDIDKAFTGSIPRVDPPLTYKAGIVAVGVTMVLLPLLYMALIGVVGYGVLHHMMVNTSWMQSLGYKLGTVAYITPIVAGVTIVLFMVKPLFARPAGEPKTITLDPLKEPIFIHFVNKIALAVGAPRPKHIQVDCDVNASASFHRGIFGFIGNELVLTIGLPLLAGFNARQLAGVLAHEFGHFSQGVGMRFHYLIYKINSWLFNAVYTRDSWDQKLDEVAEQSRDWLNVILNIARGGVWITRKILYVFMMAGHTVSSYMLRQMEFDADRYETLMAGSEQFKDTTLQLQKLGVAFRLSHDHLAKAWEEKKLVNDFPSLIAHNASQLPPELGKALLQQMEEAQTQIYDSHPSDKQRIDRAMQEQAAGIFNLHCESRELFKAFDYLAKQVTVHHYANDLGLEFEKDKLVDVNQVVKITRDHEQQQEAYHDYFKEMAPVFAFPLSVNIFDTSKLDWDKLVEQYQETNERIANEAVSRNRLMSQANKAYRQYQIFDAIDLLKQARVVMLPEWFDLDEESFGLHKQQWTKVEQQWQQLMDQLKPLFELNDTRLSIALTLLNHPKLIGLNREHAHHLKMRNRLSLLINNFKRNTDTIIDFEYKKFRLTALLSCARAIGQKVPELQTVSDKLLEEFKQAFVQLSNSLHRLDYPFVGEGEHETIAGHLEGFLPKRNQCASELEYYLSSGNIIEEKLESIYARIMSGLAAVALTVDRLLPALDEEQQPSIEEKPVQATMAGGSAMPQSNLAFKSSESMDPQDNPEKHTQSARAFFDAAVTGGGAPAKSIMPADMNPGVDVNAKAVAGNQDKATVESEAMANLLKPAPQPDQLPMEAEQTLQPSQADETESTAPAAVDMPDNQDIVAPAELPENTKDTQAKQGDLAVIEEDKKVDSGAESEAMHITDIAAATEPGAASDNSGTQFKTRTTDDNITGKAITEKTVPEAESPMAAAASKLKLAVAASADAAAQRKAPASETEKNETEQPTQPAPTAPTATTTGITAATTEATTKTTTKTTAAPTKAMDVHTPEPEQSEPHANKVQTSDDMTKSIDSLKQTISELSLEPLDPPASETLAQDPVAEQDSDEILDVDKNQSSGDNTSDSETQMPGQNHVAADDTLAQGGDLDEEALELAVVSAMSELGDIEDDLPLEDDDNEAENAQQVMNSDSITTNTDPANQPAQQADSSDSLLTAELATDQDELPLDLDQSADAEQGVENVAIPDSEQAGLDFAISITKANSPATVSAGESGAAPDKAFQIAQEKPVTTEDTIIPGAAPAVTESASSSAGPRNTPANMDANTDANATQEQEKSKPAAANDRLSQALEEMARKRNNLQAYLSQVANTVVTPGTETAARYNAVKADSFGKPSDRGEDKGNAVNAPKTNAPLPGTSSTTLKPTYNASSISDSVSNLKQMTQVSIKPDPSASLEPPAPFEPSVSFEPEPSTPLELPDEDSEVKSTGSKAADNKLSDNSGM